MYLLRIFFCEKIIEMHNAWIEYANQMICKEKTNYFNTFSNG